MTPIHPTLDEMNSIVTTAYISYACLPYFSRTLVMWTTLVIYGIFITQHLIHVKKKARAADEILWDNILITVLYTVLLVVILMFSKERNGRKHMHLCFSFISIFGSAGL